MFAVRNRTLWLVVALLALIASWVAVRQRFPSERSRPAASQLDPEKLREPTLTPDASGEALRAIACQVSDAVAAEFPTDARALEVKAQVQFSLGQHAAAREMWRRCAALDPARAAEYHAVVGLAAVECGDHEEAVAYFRQALAAGSQDPQLLVPLAESLMALGRVDEAVSWLEQRIHRQALPATAMTVLGQGYLQLEQCEKALSAFQVALDLDAQDKRACYGSVMAAMRLGQRDKAAAYMQQFRELDDADAESRVEGLRTFDDQVSARDIARRTLIRAAGCYRRHRFLEEAVSLLREAAALSPADVESRVELVSLYEACDAHAEALAVCRQLRAIDPENTDYLMNAGVLHARLGEFDAALEALGQAVEREPDNAQYRDAYRHVSEGK